MDETEELFSIGDVSAQIGLEPDTLRYFEREGIVPSPRRDDSGHRRYTTGDIELIRMLVHLRETGMPLADIAQFTSADDAAPIRPTFGCSFSPPTTVGFRTAERSWTAPST